MCIRRNDVVYMSVRRHLYVMGLLDKSTQLKERNLSIDKTDNKLFMQYLFQKRQLHRIEFSGAREKAQVGGS